MSAENVKSQVRKRTLEYCILLLLEKEPAYTSDIIQKLQEAKLIVIEGTLYPFLTRLRNSELLGYQWIESAQGPPREYYQLTEKGEPFLGELETSWQKLNNTINHIRNNQNERVVKKTLTISLGGIVFCIDEDAYQLLDKYLSNLRIHFRKEEGSGEIMDDFEMRISELLNERIRLSYEVIAIEQVEEVIKRMGKPEGIFKEEEESVDHEDNYRMRQQETHAQTTKKRLARDLDNRILRDVAGGFTAYMDWDSTAVRIVLFLLMFFCGITVPLYFLSWIIVPMTHATTEKFEVRGQSVTVEDIGKTVTDGLERVSNNVNDFISSGEPRDFFQKLTDVFILVIGFILKFFIILVGIFLLPPLMLVVLILVVVTFALLMGETGFIYNLSPFGADSMNGASLSMAIMGCIGTILFIGIPIFSLIYAICYQLFKVHPLPAQAKWILLASWLISPVLCGVYIHQFGILYD